MLQGKPSRLIKVLYETVKCIKRSFLSGRFIQAVRIILYSDIIILLNQRKNSIDKEGFRFCYNWFHSRNQKLVRKTHVRWKSLWRKVLLQNNAIVDVSQVSFYTYKGFMALYLTSKHLNYCVIPHRLTGKPYFIFKKIILLVIINYLQNIFFSLKQHSNQ